MSIPGKNIENNITRILSRDRERDQVEVEVGVRIPGDAVPHIPGGMDVHINGNLNLIPIFDNFYHSFYHLTYLLMALLTRMRIVQSGD